jgi:hypothetical protein
VKVSVHVYAAGADTAGKSCSICQSGIIAGEHIVFCPDCALPFHEECWKENGGCSQYGCPGAPETPKADAGADSTRSVWGDEKPCPACGRSIKAMALKCRHCGASFETRDAISPGEYRQREYSEQEYLKARNKIVVLFLLAGTGCFSVVALILLGMLVFGKRSVGIEYDRLPKALKALSVLGFGLSCLLLFLGLMFAILD